MDRSNDDSLLLKLVEELIKKHRCHTVILYGSRARGDATSSSDYDLLGIKKTGEKYRLAEKRNGIYLDIFISPEKEFRKVGEEHLYMKGAKLLYQRGTFGVNFLKKLKKATQKKYQPLSANERKLRQVWLHKMYDRIRQGEIEGNYRRSWLHEALLSEYFNIRKKRYWGSKQSFQWLIQNDLATYKLFDRVLKNPFDMKLLKKLVERVSLMKM
jgi:predicted nucleotidyltransferase